MTMTAPNDEPADGKTQSRIAMRQTAPTTLRWVTLTALTVAIALALWPAGEESAATRSAAAAAPAQEQQPPREPIFGHRLDQFERFSGETTIRTADGDRNVRVDVRNWIIGSGMRIDELPLPFRGLMVVQLRGGELTTVIDDERQERLEGEIWTVPAGVAMRLETEDDSAIVQTVVVGE